VEDLVELALAQPENPLTGETGVVEFAHLRAEHVIPGVEALLHQVEAALVALENDAKPDWHELVCGIERIDDRVHFVWGTVEHLLSVRNTPELRAAHQAMQPRVVGFTMRLRQSRAIFDKLQALRRGPAWASASEGQRRTVEALLQDAVLSGVALTGAPQRRFFQLTLEMEALSTTFSNNVLDATAAFAMDLTEPSEVVGLPRSLRELAAHASSAPGATAESGPWRITLDEGSFRPFMGHSQRRDLREKLYVAMVTRACSGPLDNRPVILEILRRRRECAALLGAESWAQCRLSRRMAGHVARALEWLEELRRVAYPVAQRELGEIVELARRAGAPEADGMEPWDRLFWMERAREARHGLDAEQVRAYCPLPRVLDGLLDLIRRLFGATIREAPEPAGWHRDVRCYHVEDERGTRLGTLFLDLHARAKEKNGGAWVTGGLRRSALFPRPNGGDRLPTAYVMCNFARPIGARPTLLSFDDVQTLFHEFGHALQHVLTKVPYGLVAGNGNIEWDAIEVPSLFMEKWCHHEPTLRRMTAHVETGQPLPQELREELCAARTFYAGNANLHQLRFALLDLELHHRFDPDGAEQLEALQARVSAPFDVGRRFEGDRSVCTFLHVFSWSYSAGYYCYKWAEVLAADAFAAFEEVGLCDPEGLATVGRRFADTVLALGGSRHPLDVFRDFRGRAPTTAAFLRQSGLWPG
jgi:oligopeptidase A